MSNNLEYQGINKPVSLLCYARVRIKNKSSKKGTFAKIRLSLNVWGGDPNGKSFSVCKNKPRDICPGGYGNSTSNTSIWLNRFEG